MANDKNKQDWLIANITSPQNTIGDFAQEGLTQNNTQLLDKDEYKKNERIRSTFVNPETGEFDEERFDTFYDHSVQTYNSFVKDRYDTSVLNGDYYSDANIWVDPKEKRLTNYVNIRKEKNPFGSTAGHTTLRHRSPGEFSIREIAQTQGIYDPATGKFLDKTPNDLGFWGTFLNKDTFVISTYDEDGEHYDDELERMVPHKAGDMRFNAEGKPVYEKLGNREVYGRQVLSPFDVLTRDASWANKYDFMDSDGLNKSIFGTVMKTAATIAPFLIPGVNKVWTALTLSNMIANDLAPVLVKSSAGLLFGDSIQDNAAIQTLNQMEGFGRRFRNTVSDNAQQSMWRTENIFGLVGDVFGQIAQQRFIAQIPGWLGSTRAEAQVLSKAAQRGRSAEDLSAIRTELKGIKNWDERLSFLSNKFGNNQELADIVNKWQRWSSASGRALGMTYMAGIASTGMAEEAKLQGLDERDTAALFFGSFAALNALFAKVDIMSWTLKGIGLDDISKHLNKTIRKNVKELAPEMRKVQEVMSGRSAGSTIVKEAAKEGAEDAVEAQAKKAWYTTLFANGKNATTKAFKSLTESLDESTGLIGRSMLNESIEETSEEVVADALKTIYNGARALGLTSTPRDEVEPFDVFDEMLSRYAMSALGGALGGGLVGFQDRLAGRLHSSLPKSLTTELSSIILHGHGEKFLTHLEKQWRAGKLAPEGITASVEKISSKISNEPAFKPVREPNDISQNDLIYNLIKNEMEFLKRAIYQEGDINDFDMAPVYELRESQLLDLKHTSAIRDDIKLLVDQIIDLQAQISDTEKGIKSGTDAEREEDHATIAKLNSQIEPLRENLRAILDGENVQDYVSQAIFNLADDLNKAYGVKDKQHYATYLKNKHYDNLTPIEKGEVDAAYNDYVNYEKKRQSLVGYERFQKDLEYQKKRIEGLRKVAAQRKALFDSGQLTTTEVIIDSWDEEGKKVKVARNIDTTLLHLTNALNDLDAFIQKPTDVAISQTQTDSVIRPEETEVTLGTQIKRLLDVMKSQDYIDPEMAAYVKNIVKIKLFPKMANQDGTIEQDASTILYSILRSLDTEGEVFFIAGELTSRLNRLINANKHNLNTMGIGDFVNELRKGLEELENLFNLDFKVNQAIDLFYESMFNGIVSVDNNTIVKNIIEESGPEGENLQIYVDTLSQFVEDSAELKSILEEKAINPLHEMLSDMANMDGVTELKDLFDNVADLYADISKVGLDQFIINSKLDKQHLEYALSLTERVKAMLLASTQWDSADLAEQKMIGYSAAINKLNEGTEGYEPLPMLTVGEATTLNDYLGLFAGRLQFLLALSDSNVNGTVRDSKVRGARAATLYLSSLAPESENYKLLESLGFDLSKLESLFLNASAYKENLKAIKESTENTPLSISSSDADIAKLRIEKDQIEQEIYRLFNDVDPDTRVDNFTRAIAGLSLDGIDFSPVDLDKDSRAIGRLQEIMYLFQTATIDTKQFYKDIAGDVGAEVNELTETNIIPFLNQEMILKQVYFSIMSKHKKGLDVYNEVIKKIAPKETASNDERVSHYRNREDTFTLYNSIFVDGIPGAGKTTIVANYINNVIAKYDMNIAIYAPFESQANNLNSTINNKATILNSDGGSSTFTSLFESILGKNLYTKIKQDIEAGLISDKPNEVSSTIRHILPEITARHKEALAKDPNANFSDHIFTDKINTNNPEVAKFLNEFKAIRVNGKVPNVLVIDEATHINSSLLELLNLVVQKHNENNKEKVSIVFLGDTEQNGAMINYNNSEDSDARRVVSNIGPVNVIATPKMNQSFRSFYSIINDNITSIRAFRTATTNAIINKDEPSRINGVINLSYKFDDEAGLIGYKTVDEISLEDVQQLVSGIKPGGDKLAVITDKADSVVIQHLSALNAKGIKVEYEIFSPESVQGLERDFVVIDLSKNAGYDFDLNNAPKFQEDINRIYTALSRAKKGAIINHTTNGITLKSSDENVNPYVVELNTQNLVKFKEFTIDNIRKSFSNLAEYDQHLGVEKSTTYVPQVTRTGIEASERLADDLAAGNGGILGPEDTNSTSNVKGYKTSIDQSKTIVYTFHNRLGVGIDPNTNKIAKPEHLTNEDADLQLLARLHSGQSTKLELDALNLGLGNFMLQHKTLTTALGKWFTDESVRDLSSDLYVYLSSAGINNNIIEGLRQLNFEDWRIGVLVKDFDPIFDQSNSRIPSGTITPDKSQIGYLVYYNEDPDSTLDGAFNQFITIGALPNLKNKNLPPPVRASLSSLFDIAKKQDLDKVFFNLNDGVDPFGFLEPTNITLYKDGSKVLPKPEPLSVMKRNHSHLSISEPMVISNESLFPTIDSPTEDKVDHAIKQLGDPLTLKTKSRVRLNGSPFILVSTNKARQLTNEQFLDLYLNQSKKSEDEPEYLGDIRMVMLKPKTRGFAEWFNWNYNLVKDTFSPTGGQLTDSQKAELSAAENNYAAAKMISRFAWMLNTYYQVRNELKPGATIDYSSFLPTSVINIRGKDRELSVNQIVDEFMKDLQDMMNIIVPATMGLSYIELWNKLTGYAPKPGSPEFNVKDLIERIKSREGVELTRIQQMYSTDYVDRDSVDRAALEHLITKKMIVFIQNGGEKIGGDYELNESDRKFKLTKTDKGALRNMVVAMRVAISGGKFTSALDNKPVSVKGVFNAATNKQEAINRFLSELQAVLTDPPYSSSEKYKPLFPGGIQSNVVYRKRNDENRFSGALPYAIPSGTAEAEFEVVADIQTPKLPFDFSVINTNPVFPKTVEERKGEDILAAQFKDKVVKLGSELKIKLDKLLSSESSARFNERGEMEKKIDQVQSSITGLSNATIQDIKARLGELTPESIASFNLDDVESEILIILNEHLDRSLLPNNNRTDEFVLEGLSLKMHTEVTATSTEFKAGFNGRVATKVSQFIMSTDEWNQIVAAIPNYEQLIKERKLRTPFKFDPNTNKFNIYQLIDGNETKIATFAVINKSTESGVEPVFEIQDFKIISGKPSELDTTNWDNFKKSIMTKYKDDSTAIKVLGGFIDLLDAAVANDFTNIESEASLQMLADAYIDASVKLRSDPEALKALQEFYAKSLNPLTC